MTDMQLSPAIVTPRASPIVFGRAAAVRPDRVPRPRAAFTLIELMVVLVLMAILAALIVPEMKGTFEEERLRAAIRELMRACRLASSQSVALHQRHRVRIDPRAGRFVVERWAAPSDGDPGFRPLPDLPGSAGRFDRRLQVEIRPAAGDAFLIPDPEIPPGDDDAVREGRFSSDAILFFPDGRAQSREVWLKDRQGFEWVLRIHPVNGRVQIHKEASR